MKMTDFLMVIILNKWREILELLQNAPVDVQSS